MAVSGGDVRQKGSLEIETALVELEHQCWAEKATVLQDFYDVFVVLALSLQDDG